MNEDVRVEGEQTETPSDSQSGTITTESSIDDSSQGASSTSPEEVAWNNLKGGTQDRIKSILNERDEYRAQTERLNQFVRTNNPFQQTANMNQSTPEVQNAVQKLSEVGIATDEKVDQKINQRIGNLIYNFELEKLESRYDGANGLPKFDRSEYQDFVTRNPKYQNYQPEDVYQKMYEEEILDAKVKSYKANPGQSTTSSLRPSRTTVREEQWSNEWLDNRMKQSDGLEWYSKNKDKVNNWLASQVSE